MLVKVAWRNIWRSRLRTGVLIMSIAFGLWAGVFTMGLMWGMSEQRLTNSVATYFSHVQIHDREYREDNDVAFDIGNWKEVAGLLDTLSGVRSHTERMLLAGMASTAQGASGVQIMAIDPTQERTVTDVYKKVTEGSYFESDRRNQVLVGRKLAHKLGVRMRSKIVLTFQDENSDLTAGAFRITGIFETTNSVWDETTVFVRRNDAAQLFGADRIHQIAVYLEDANDSNSVRDRLNERFPELRAETWAQISPELGYTFETLDQSMYIFVMVILLGMAFGIVNSMLMAVLERKHELGMLLCIGMSKLRVFGMIVLETVFIIGVGGPLGLLFAILSIGHFGRSGIDLAVVGDGLRSLGLETVIYPALGFNYYLNITIMVVLAAILSALYPAWRAVKYDPAEAVRA
ncbi:MAG: ABC transporter permease, partial [Rhodothermia bacterium]